MRLSKIGSPGYQISGTFTAPQAIDGSELKMNVIVFSRFKTGDQRANHRLSAN
jgi:hypothetical protein